MPPSPIFAATYAMLAQRHGLFVSLGGAGVLWLGIAAALRMVEWTPLGAMAINVVVYAVTIPLSWRFRAGGGPVKFVRTPFDIPLRALTAAVVVAVVTAASSSIGSFASGMFALFPIILGSSIVIMHPRIGGKATASMLAHAQLPLIGLAFGFLAVHYLVGADRRVAGAGGGACRFAGLERLAPHHPHAATEAKCSPD